MKSNHCTFSKRTSERGLTVLELVLALVVLGILMAVIVPRIDLAFRRTRLQSAVMQMTTAHFTARTAAMRYGRPSELKVDASNGLFYVTIDTAFAGGKKDTLGTVSRMSSLGITMTSTRTTLCFDRRGLGYSSSTCDSANVVVTFSAAGRTDTFQTTILGKVVR